MKTKILKIKGDWAEVRRCNRLWRECAFVYYMLKSAVRKETKR